MSDALLADEDTQEDDAVAGPRPIHQLLGLTDDEYDEIVKTLGREPRSAELAMYSVMWSEHCSYKSSRIHLRRFPTEAPWVVVGPGENAGVVDIGDGWLVALRIESHNHPSFVEPYQGAATGVGGIIRDVFTMGARPIALWDSIRVGPLTQARTRSLLNGVVAGIAGYGNAVGVPTVGGEMAFAEHYSNNPLVNVMCLGILRREQLVLARSGEEGTVAVLLGAATGRDGIGGASLLASASFEESSEEKRPSVQVGDPFEEKKLIEACLELYQEGLVVGVQDLGAAGLSCALSEPVARSGMGIDVDLDLVHVREPGMTAPELLMSESQERMMAFVEPDQVEQVMKVAEKWEIEAAVIGTVREGGQVRVKHDGELVAEVPADSLSEGAPRYLRPSGEPGWMEDLWSNTVKFMAQPAIATSLLQMLDDPGLASKAWAYQQYDHMLFLNTVVGPGHDGSLLRVKGTDKALALSVDGDGRLCYLDPRRGAARLVYEGALQVALCGARPMAVVDNLNFGNPEKPEVMWQLRESIEGISEACEGLGIPVIGGNVSLYNETNGIDIYPTPVVGVLGLADPMPSRPPRLDQAEEGMEVWVFGGEWAINLAGSAFELVTFAHVGGRPTAPDPGAARAAISTALWLAEQGIAPVMHDISSGGLALAVAEIAIASGVGVTVNYSDWRHLFCEDPHRFVAAIPSPASAQVAELARGAAMPAAAIGRFGGNEIVFDRHGIKASVDLEVATTTWRDARPRRLA
ncbi:MAG TPA: phosphoribosylformylglycinamidine synthase subunit PurL [Acidimicrobiia bacterium]|nr:phosphoribosylformylglycinamidine synthase subunit PurL [Acidimicrobiia bacterium]